MLGDVVLRCGDLVITDWKIGGYEVGLLVIAGFY
jgi:hypothetical protein